MEPSDTIPTVSISIPLQTLTHAADAQPEREAIAEHESGWRMFNKEGKTWTAAYQLTLQSAG